MSKVAHIYPYIHVKHELCGKKNGPRGFQTGLTQANLKKARSVKFQIYDEKGLSNP